MDKVEGLISVLLDRSARVDERDDAAMDLREYDDDRALNALLSILLDPNEEPFIMYACGESIAQIWTNRNYFNPDLYTKMDPKAQLEIYLYVKGYKPEWIKNHKVLSDFDKGMQSND